MLHFKVKPLYIQDDTRDLPIKDKNGVPTQLTRKYRFLTIQAMVKDSDLKIDRPIVIKSVDPTYALPAVGVDWDTPEVRSYRLENGVPVVDV